MSKWIEKDRVDMGAAHTLSHASSSLEDVVACRWLLENLPVTSGLQKGVGIQWRTFWQIQWNQYTGSVKSGRHLLRTLEGNEKYNSVGMNFYGTLSNVLHGYGHLRDVPLHPDVQTMIKTIRAVHYNKDKQIDIEAERRRWLTGKLKFAT